MSGERVLVTGGSGFVGAHCILKLLESGYGVRTTVRSPGREAEVRAMLKQGGAQSGDTLAFVTADLSADAGWPEAVEGCDYVLHVASPFPARQPKDANELIVPAREGTLRVLRAARDAGVRRVVLTSSFAAIGYGPAPAGRPFDERDWTDPALPVSPYVKSKTIAERVAWDFIAGEGEGLELCVVNPTVIMGPALGSDLSTSLEVIKGLLEGQLPGLPQLSFGVVDVRDVAELHLLAMTNPAASGERFLAVAGDFLSIEEMALALRARMGSAAGKVPTRVLPDWLVRFAALFSARAALAATELGKVKNGSSEKAGRVLGWKPRSTEDAIVASAESLIRLGLIGPSK